MASPIPPPSRLQPPSYPSVPSQPASALDAISFLLCGCSPHHNRQRSIPLPFCAPLLSSSRPPAVVAILLCLSCPPRIPPVSSAPPPQPLPPFPFPSSCATIASLWPQSQATPRHFPQPADPSRNLPCSLSWPYGRPLHPSASSIPSPSPFPSSCSHALSLRPISLSRRLPPSPLPSLSNCTPSSAPPALRPVSIPRP